MSDVGRRIRWASFLRTFAIQGSWNYRTLIGTGFAWALLPVLRRVHGEEALDDAVTRHSSLFNAHPYLASLAVGAVARLEADHAGTETIERFKMALRGPLGALGDRLVWGRLLPVTLLCGLIAWVLGAPPWISVLVFLVPYNVAHLALRAWGFRTGYATGRDVGHRLRSADLGGWAERLGVLASGLIGTLLGALGADMLDQGFAGLPILGLLAVAFWLGVRAGERAWRGAVAVAERRGPDDGRVGARLMSQIQQRVRIVNRLGLHARPAAALVQLASGFDAAVEVARGELSVNAKSIMGVLMLAAENGAELTIRASGPEAEAAVAALASLVARGFEDHDEGI